MNAVWRLIGRSLYVVGWPAIYLFVNGTERTRIILLSNKKVLLVQSWIGDGCWNLPGGGLHHGEPYPEGASRELAEEIGLHMAARHLRYVGSTPVTERNITCRIHFLTATVPAGMPFKAIFPEIIAVQWFDIQALPAQLNPEVSKGLQLLASI